MEHPKLTFAFDWKRDVQIALDFHDHPSWGGVDFWQKGALRLHDGLADFEKESDKEDALSRYVSKIYAEHGAEFEIRKKEISLLYESKKDLFFAGTEKIFKNHPWPNGKYVAYLSVFDFCPRFLDNKTFWLFLYDSDEGILFTIFHEMLHFLFYDYCSNVHPEIFRDLDTETGPFWEIAELFDAIVMHSTHFERLHLGNYGIGYPELELQFNLAKEAWDDDLEKWIKNFAAPYVMQKGKQGNL